MRANAVLGYKYASILVLILSISNIILPNTAKAQSPSDIINDRIDGSWFQLDPIKSVTASYSYADRQAGNLKAESHSLTLAYAHQHFLSYREFAFLSCITTDFRSTTSGSDSIGVTAGYGKSVPIAEGLNFSLSGFAAVNTTDLAAQANNTDVYSAGMVAALSQSLPLSTKLFANIHASYTPRLTFSSKSNDDDFYLAHAVNASAKLFYTVTQN
jgi:hypothetical protein